MYFFKIYLRKLRVFILKDAKRTDIYQMVLAMRLLSGEKFSMLS